MMTVFSSPGAREKEFVVGVVAHSLGFQGCDRQRVEGGQIVRLRRQGAPVEVVREQLPIRVAQFEFHEVNRRECGGPLHRAQAGGSASGGGGGIVGSAGIAIDDSGNVSVYATGGAGSSAPGVTGANGGLTVAGSDATTVSDLSGPFAQQGVGAGAEDAASVDTFEGLSSDGLVIGGALTGGGGGGVTDFNGATDTWVSPSINIFDIGNDIADFLDDAFDGLDEIIFGDDDSPDSD